MPSIYRQPLTISLLPQAVYQSHNSVCAKFAQTAEGGKHAQMFI